MTSKFKLNNKTLLIAATFVVFIFSWNITLAEVGKNFKQVEATGRAVLIDGDIEVTRKRALEDALYLAALKGGADVNGFSAISSNTIINDQSVVRATNRVFDFKIIDERQDKEFLSIKITAIVGGKTSAKNCNIRPINITLFRGSYNVESGIPSKLTRKTSKWYNDIYDIISKLSNVKAVNERNNSLEQIIKSNINPSYDYNALTKGIPLIQAGDYSLVPELQLSHNNIDNHFSNYLLKVSLKVYKGDNFELTSTKSYYLPIEYEFNTKFQFIRNISTLSIDLVDKKVNEHLMDVAQNFLRELNCRPLEGKLILEKGKLRVGLGRKQGIKQKQIGLVKGINIKNSMLSNSSLIVHVDKIYDNYSILLPLNDNVKLDNLNSLIVEFVE